MGGVAKKVLPKPKPAPAPVYARQACQKFLKRNQLQLGKQI